MFWWLFKDRQNLRIKFASLVLLICILQVVSVVHQVLVRFLDFLCCLMRTAHRSLRNHDKFCVDLDCAWSSCINIHVVSLEHKSAHMVDFSLPVEQAARLESLKFQETTSVGERHVCSNHWCRLVNVPPGTKSKQRARVPQRPKTTKTPKPLVELEDEVQEFEPNQDAGMLMFLVCGFFDPPHVLCSQWIPWMLRLPLQLFSRASQLASHQGLRDDFAYQRNVAMLAEAQRSIISTRYNKALSRAFLARASSADNAPSQSVFTVGDQVMYWRRNNKRKSQWSMRSLGPGTVIGHEGRANVRISHRNAGVKAAGIHVRLAEVEEKLPWHDLYDSLRDTDEQTYFDLCPPGASRNNQYGNPSTGSDVPMTPIPVADESMPLRVSQTHPRS